MSYPYIPCADAECGKLMRPRGTLAVDHPGTVALAARGLCSGCYTRARHGTVKSRRFSLDDAVRAMHAEGHYDETIAAETNASIHTIRSIRHRLGLPLVQRVKQAKPMSPCHYCGRQMRPTHTTVEDYPGTITRSTATRCVTCKNRRPSGTPIDLGPISFATPRGTDWIEQAACLDADPELFFHPEGERAAARDRRDRAAKAVCESCPVRQECLGFALKNKSAGHYGVYGGLSEDERAQIRVVVA